MNCGLLWISALICGQIYSIFMQNIKLQIFNFWLKIELILRMKFKFDKSSKYFFYWTNGQRWQMIMSRERKLSVSVSVSVSALLKLSVSADISVHSLAEILALYTAIIPTFCLKFTLFRFFPQKISRFLNFILRDKKFSSFC